MVGVRIELDHRGRWPEGRTTPANLWPGCRSDHKAEHAPGFGIEQTADGGFALVTPTGFRHRVEPTEHPSSEDFDALPPGIQFSATGLVDAIAEALEQLTSAA